MKKYIIDTNILVGAMGNYYDDNKALSNNSKIVLGALLDLYQPVFPKSLVKEYIYILKEKNLDKMKSIQGKPRPPQWFGDFLNKGLMFPDLVFNPIPGFFYTADDDDFNMLCLAVDQDYPIVTHNLKDFPEEGRYGSSVMSPREFLDLETDIKHISSWASWK